jgi:hypothetical protein
MVSSSSFNLHHRFLALLAVCFHLQPRLCCSHAQRGFSFTKAQAETCMQSVSSCVTQASRSFGSTSTARLAARAWDKRTECMPTDTALFDLARNSKLQSIHPYRDSSRCAKLGDKLRAGSYRYRSTVGVRPCPGASSSPSPRAQGFRAFFSQQCVWILLYYCRSAQTVAMALTGCKEH